LRKLSIKKLPVGGTEEHRRGHLVGPGPAGGTGLGPRQLTAIDRLARRRVEQGGQQHRVLALLEQLQRQHPDRARGLSQVRLVISDAHLGIRAAVSTVMLGSAWQRCRVHFVRNVLARVPRGSAEMVAAAIRTIFAQPDADAVGEQFDRIADMLAPQFPVVTGMLQDARTDLLAFCAFPVAHWRQIWSTNPLERLNREIKRRTDVVGVFPNDDAISRLVTAVILEQHDEWQVAERRYFAEASMATLLPQAAPPLGDPNIEQHQLAS